MVPDQTFDQYKSVTFSPVFLRGYVTQVKMYPTFDRRPAINLDMLSPPGLSGAPVIREGNGEVVGVVVGDRTIRLGGNRSASGEALLLDALRTLSERGDRSPEVGRVPRAMRQQLQPSYDVSAVGRSYDPKQLRGSTVRCSAAATRCPPLGTIASPNSKKRVCDLRSLPLA